MTSLFEIALPLDLKSLLFASKCFKTSNILKKIVYRNDPVKPHDSSIPFKELMYRNCHIHNAVDNLSLSLSLSVSLCLSPICEIDRVSKPMK